MHHTESPPSSASGAARREPAVQLAAGLTRLGRPWGVRSTPVPTDHEAHTYLSAAVSLGVRIFDTAPSYGTSEARLGRFLQSLKRETRDTLFIATKFGEWWDTSTNAITVDHSFDALARSLDTSLRLLGPIDLIQLHRSDAPSLTSSGVRRAFAHARASGVGAIGVSVSRVDVAHVALEQDDLDWLQFPYHVGNSYMEEIFAMAERRGCRVLVNRPFGMGALVAGENTPSAVEAFGHILKQRFHGAVLTGTVSATHLGENLAAFDQARRDSLGGSA